jgi:hypothetical protein
MTTDYERGFSAGERKAWEDRNLIRQLVRPKEAESEWQRGYMDGYFPRSLTWSLRKPAIRSYAEIDE